MRKGDWKETRRDGHELPIDHDFALPLIYLGASNRLRDVEQESQPLNRFTAEVIANGIADRPPDNLHITEIDVVPAYHGYAIHIGYEFGEEAHQRLLRSLDAVLRFLADPVDFTTNSSPDGPSEGKEMF
ncbi:MAG TPA: hypothetical protein VFB34_08405 [Chloroflexota bacterium]|nr:hypothetical protein [Chloroflexota bacterium]